MSQPREWQEGTDTKTGTVQTAWVVSAGCNPISISLWLRVCSWRVAVAQLSLLFCYNNPTAVSKPSSNLVLGNARSWEVSGELCMVYLLGMQQEGISRCW